MMMADDAFMKIEELGYFFPKNSKNLFFTFLYFSPKNAIFKMCFSFSFRCVEKCFMFYRFFSKSEEV